MEPYSTLIDKISGEKIGSIFKCLIHKIFAVIGESLQTGGPVVLYRWSESI